MPTANVVAKFVNAPRGASRYGSIKDANGEYWSVPSTMLNQFAVNGSYNVEYNTTDKDGKTYKNIQRIVSSATNSTGASPRQSMEDPQKTEDIFVMTVLKGWAPNIPVGDTAGLLHAINSAKTAWRQSKTKPLPSRIESGPQNDPEFNDEIPENFR